MLLEKLESKINELVEKLDDNIDISEELLESLEGFSSNVSKDELALAEVEDPNKYLEKVYGEKESFGEIKETIENLKKIVTGKKKAPENLKDIFNLTEEQKEFLKKTCNDIWRRTMKKK